MKKFQNTILAASIINKCDESGLIHLLRSMQYELIEDTDLKIMIRTLLNSAENIKNYSKTIENRFFEGTTKEKKNEDFE